MESGMRKGLPACALIAALAACQPGQQGSGVDAADPAWAAPATKPAPSAATAHRVIVDGRDATSWPQPIGEAEENALLSVIGMDAASGDWIETVWDGAFTRAGASQRAVLVAHGGGPASIVPFPAPSTLVVLEGGSVVEKLDLPKDDAGYRWIAGIADVGADGIDELLLRNAWLQMGESGSSYKVVSLEGGQYRVDRTFERAGHSDCDAPHVDDPRVEASVIALQGGQLVARKYRAECPAPAPGQATTPDPEPEDFVPVDEGAAVA